MKSSHLLPLFFYYKVVALKEKMKEKAIQTKKKNILFYCSSSPTGRYQITIGNVTWKTRCRMNEIPGCEHGAWELVMRINGSMV